MKTVIEDWQFDIVRFIFKPKKIICIIYCKFCLNIAIYLRNSFGFWIRVGIEPMDELAPTDALWFVLDSEFIYGA